MNITYLCVCAWHACVRVPGRVGLCMRVRIFSLSYAACNSYAPCRDVICGPLAPPYFSTFCHKRNDFRRKTIRHKTCVLIFCTTLIWNTSHSKKNLARYFHKCENVFMTSTRYSCRILMKLNVLDRFSKKFKNKVPSKFVQMGDELFHEGGRTDGRTEGRTHMLTWRS
jgi:hypothetical protein